MSEQALALAPASAPARWWLAWRAPGPVDAFRAVAAVSLAAHFAVLARNTVPVMTRALAGLSEGVGADAGPVVRPWLLDGGLSPAIIDGVFVGAIALALLTGIGIAPRATAVALLAVSVAIYRAVFPIADESDFLANVMALFLVSMPAGRTFAPFGRRSRRDARVPGAPVTIFLVAVTAYYISGQLSGADPSDGARLAAAIARFIPIAFVLPVPGLRWLAIGAQLLVHGYLLATAHAVLPNVVLAASGLLFWGDTGEGSEEWTLDAGAAVGVLAVAALALGAVLPSRIEAQAPPALHVLADLGLLQPPPGPAPHPGLVRHLAVLDGASHRREPLEGGPPWQKVVDRIASDDSPGRLSLAVSVARGYCREQGNESFVGALVWSAEGADHHLFDFECSTGGALYRVR
jgi:hypothetical protein